MQTTAIKAKERGRAVCDCETFCCSHSTYSKQGQRKREESSYHFVFCKCTENATPEKAFDFFP